jgi:hypothetical protein
MKSISLVILFTILFFSHPVNISGQELSKKWFPGHYAAVRHLNGPLAEGSRNLVKNNPYIKGYKMHIVWNELELSKDQYDFTVIQNFINIAETDGKKILLHLQDRKFGKNENPFLPAYMLTSEYEGGWFLSEKGHSYGKIWLPAYQDRWCKLLKALGEFIDASQTVAGLIVSESSMNTNTPGYNTAGHMDFFTSMHSTIANYAPNTVFFQYVNWGFTMDERTILMKNVVEDNRNGFGGPDIYDHKYPTTNRTWTLNMAFGSFYSKYRGTAPISVENQPAGYNAASARQVFDYAVDQIGVHFLPWSVYNATDRNYTFKDDVLPILNAEQGRINTTPPLNVLKSTTSNQTVKQTEFKVYPNPSSDFIKLEFTADQMTEGRYQIFDITGKLLENNSISEPFISIKHLPNGSYFIKVSKKDHDSELKKFIKI